MKTMNQKINEAMAYLKSIDKSLFRLSANLDRIAEALEKTYEYNKKANPSIEDGSRFTTE